MDLRKKASSDKTIALQCDADGKLRHDAVVRIGHSKDKVGLDFFLDPHCRINYITVINVCYSCLQERVFIKNSLLAFQHALEYRIVSSSYNKP